MKHKILITGGSGFVGSHIGECLLRHGYEIIYTIRSKSSLSYIPYDANVVIIDLNDVDKMITALQGVNTVVHAAGITRACKSSDYFIVNSHGTKSLAQAAVKSGVSRFIFISSLSARGPDNTLRPVSIYGKSKLAAETSLYEFKNNLEIICLRPSAVYGPRDKDFFTLFRMAQHGFMILPAVCRPIQLIYATDIADACVAAVRMKRPIPQSAMSLASREMLSWEMLVQIMSNAIGKRIKCVKLPALLLEQVGLMSEVVSKFTLKPPTFDRRRARDIALYTYTCDTSIVEQALDWQAKTPFCNGIKQTLDWYKKEKWL